MQALNVQVKNGRLVFDEPTDLPDGADVEVVVIDDELTVDERAGLHASLDRLLDEAQRRFEAEDEWWREHRDAKELFVEKFAQTLEQLSSMPGRGSATASHAAS